MLNADKKLLELNNSQKITIDEGYYSNNNFNRNVGRANIYQLTIINS